MRVIEITGPPGSGKSTVVGAIRECLEGHEFTTCDASDLVLRCGQYPFDRKIWRGLISLLPGGLYRKCLRGVNNYLYLKYEYRLRFYLRHLSMFEELQSLQSSMGIREDHRERAMKVLLNTGGHYQMALDAPDLAAVFLLDEGFIHRAVSLFVSHHQDQPAAEPQIIENYVRTAPPCQAVIRVEAPHATCAQRLRGRTLPKRLTGSSERDVECYIARSSDVIDIATCTLQQMGVFVYTVQNSEESFSSENIAEQLDGFVQAFRQSDVRTDKMQQPAVDMTATTMAPALRDS